MVFLFTLFDMVPPRPTTAPFGARPCLPIADYIRFCGEDYPLYDYPGCTIIRASIIPKPDTIVASFSYIEPLGTKTRDMLSLRKPSDMSNAAWNQNLGKWTQEFYDSVDRIPRVPKEALSFF